MSITMIKTYTLALLLGLLGWAPLAALAEAGRVEFVSGEASLLAADGSTVALRKGDSISAGDTLVTGQGRLQARFSDGGYVSLQPDTRFKVEQYHYDGVADGSERGLFHLIKGGMRAITGAIGHKERRNYQVDTPVATIGIRGTEFVAQYDDRLLVKVGDGAVYLANAAGDLILYKGQSGEVAAGGSKPRRSMNTPSVGAAAPPGSGAVQLLDALADAGVQQIFAAGDVRDGSGVPCAASGADSCQFLQSLPSAGNDPATAPGTPATVAAIQQANFSRATGSWSSTPIVFDAGGFSGRGTLVSRLNVDFSNYALDASVTARFPLISGTASASGSLGSDGRFGALTPTGSSGLACPVNSCTLAVSGGSISGAGLSAASMDFSMHGFLLGGAINNQRVQMGGGLN